jgi:hypothetical protein
MKDINLILAELQRIQGLTDVQALAEGITDRDALIESIEDHLDCVAMALALEEPEEKSWDGSDNSVDGVYIEPTYCEYDDSGNPIEEED